MTKPKAKRIFWMEIQLSKVEMQDIADRAGVPIVWSKEFGGWECTQPDGDEKLEDFCRALLCSA